TALSNSRRRSMGSAAWTPAASPSSAEPRAAGRGRTWWSSACWCIGSAAGLFLAALLVTTNGCSGLPDAEKEFSIAHVPPRVGTEAGGGMLGRHLIVEQATNSDSPLVGGNRLTLLHDGPATYAAMEAAIADATDHINLQTYIFH